MEARGAPVFEEHWPEDLVRRGLASGELIRGRLHVPSFHTSTAYVVVDAEALASVPGLEKEDSGGTTCLTLLV